jgi:hypothetical protein
LYAGVNAIRYLVKQAWEQKGDKRSVTVHQYGKAPWFSVSCGALSVNCLGRELREELELEKLAPNPSSVTWWRQGVQPLTLDTITAEDNDSGEESDQTSSAKHPYDYVSNLGAGGSAAHGFAAGSEQVVSPGTARLEGDVAEMPEAAHAVGVPEDCEEAGVQDVGHIERGSTAAQGKAN